MDLPGGLAKVEGGRGSWLDATPGAMAAFWPSEENAGFCHVIPDEGELLSVEAPESTRWDEVGVRVGGRNGEWIAFFNDHEVRLYQRGENELLPVHRIETPGDDHGGWFDVSNDVRFSPDGSMMNIFSRCRHYIAVTLPVKQPVIARFDEGTSVADFTDDGKHFVMFHSGGASTYDTSSWAPLIRPGGHPGICCPVEHVAFFDNGRYLLSCEGQQLLLWATDGRLLGELASPRKGAAGAAIHMQSARFHAKDRTILAADGWDFLEWDLEEVARLKEASKDSVPIVEGRIAFGLEPSERESAVVMTLAPSPDGSSFLTADRRSLVLRSGNEATLLKFPRTELPMKPRAFHWIGSGQTALIRSGYTIYVPDLGGEEPPRTLSGDMIAISEPSGWIFSFPRMQRRQLQRHSFSGEGEEDLMNLPAEWESFTGGAATGDGRWLAGVATAGNQRQLVVIDWQEKRVVWSAPFVAFANAWAISRDQTRLAVGTTTRAVYLFDLKAITAAR